MRGRCSHLWSQRSLPSPYSCTCHWNETVHEGAQGEGMQSSAPIFPDPLLICLRHFDVSWRGELQPDSPEPMIVPCYVIFRPSAWDRRLCRVMRRFIGQRFTIVQERAHGQDRIRCWVLRPVRIFLPHFGDVLDNRMLREVVVEI